MNTKLAVTLVLFSAAISSVSPALARGVARLEEHSSPCNCESTLVHKPMHAARTGRPPFMLKYAAPNTGQQDDWAAEMILGSSESRSGSYDLKTAI